MELLRTSSSRTPQPSNGLVRTSSTCSECSACSRMMNPSTCTGCTSRWTTPVAWARSGGSANTCCTTPVAAWLRSSTTSWRSTSVCSSTLHHRRYDCFVAAPRPGVNGSLFLATLAFINGSMLSGNRQTKRQ